MSSTEKVILEDQQEEDILSTPYGHEKNHPVVANKVDEFDDYEKIQIDDEDYLIMASIKLPIIAYKEEETGKWKVKEAPVSDRLWS